MTDHELAKNAEKFRNGLVKTFTENVASVIATNSAALDSAYERMTTLQAWRSYVLEKVAGSASLGFYSEAQNDGLTSIVLVAGGLWRPSLKSLRSLLENILHSMYYKDHPVEYSLWERGKFRPTFQKLFDYFESHPAFIDVPDAINSISDLRKHYSHLSEIVHASAKSARMTDSDNQTQIWKATKADVGKWATLHKNVVKDVNLLILVLMRDQVQGAANKGLREALSISIPSGSDKTIAEKLGVHILR